jgi:SAM-dependent methyltransferase
MQFDPDKRLVPPPPELQFVGDGDFITIGNEFMNHFTRLADLKPHETVLDVGCGIGRMAFPLTQYLKPPATYDGFDVSQKGIEWCNGNISRLYPHFRFQFVDVHNQAYNPGGKLNPESFEFPYRSGSFDFVFLTSVFTHRLPVAMEHYLSEISRVLRSGGRAFITFFLLNHESLKLMNASASHVQFLDCGDYRTTNMDIPEAAVAYEEDLVRRLSSRCGLTVVDPIHYGAWSGRRDHVSYQDIVIVRKPGA